jgi:hypothetical protein
MLIRGNYFWTTDDEAKLRALAARGLHARAIALRLRRSASSIRKRAHDLGVKIQSRRRRRFSIDEIAKGSP